MGKKSPTLLIILDGFGYRKDVGFNAIAAASMPIWTRLQGFYPSCLLDASGLAVGLPDGFAGNSEVGHLTLGAGRRVKGVLERFNEAIDTGEFFKNSTLLEKFTQLKASAHALHIMGLLSDAGVHSHEEHLYAYLELAKKVGLTKVFIHAFLDGRDVSPRSATLHLERLLAQCARLGLGRLATIQGRFYAMDRDANWERTQKAYDALCGMRGNKADDWAAYIAQSYAQGMSDEFLEPCIIDPSGVIKSGDGLVCINFRADRARQLASLFLDPQFHPGALQSPHLAFFITTTRYNPVFAGQNNDILFEHGVVENTLLDVLAAHNAPVFVIAETEKAAHVTYFFRGERECREKNERYVIIPSLKERNYINHPEMSAPEITTVICNSLREEAALFYLVNYANADMVGHSGSFEATKKACEHLDECLGRLYEEVVEKRGGTLFITADHGNAEEMVGKCETSHTTNQVPLLIAGKDFEGQKMSGEIRELAHVAPLILEHLGLMVPDEMKKG